MEAILLTVDQAGCDTTIATKSTQQDIIPGEPTLAKIFSFLNLDYYGIRLHARYNSFVERRHDLTSCAEIFCENSRQ